MSPSTSSPELSVSGGAAPLIAKVLGTALLSVVIGAALCWAAPAHAAEFTVTPVQASLSARAPSALLNLTNTGSHTLRFELSAYAWAQDSRGKILLSPTDDIVFFPQLLSLAPGEQRKIRVGSLSPAVDSEKTYRLFVEQLPSAGKRRSELKNGVELLTRVGIPVFVQPAFAKTEGEIAGPTVVGGKLSFAIRNSGNVHLLIEGVQVAGFGAGDRPVFIKQAKGWYILARQTTMYELDMDAAECSGSSTLEVAARTPETILRQRVPLPPSGCTGAARTTADALGRGSGG